MAPLPARAQRIHLIGIGGSGLSAIARLLLESGYTVSGSDLTLSPLTQELARAGVQVFAGHQAENVRAADVVVRSSAISDRNIEVQAALASGIPVLKRAQFLGWLMENHYGIAVAGTHGKTTITAMLAWLLVRLGRDPSYIIGGTAHNLGDRNAHAGSGSAFVIEADEYDRMFLGLRPDLIIVSAIEHDHPDCFPTPQEYFAAFAEFAQLLPESGALLTCLDSPQAGRLAEIARPTTRVFTYGTHPQADYQARQLKINARGGYDYEAWYQAEILSQISLQAPGEHNVRNSLAALAAFHQHEGQTITSQTVQQAAQALGEFTGVGRRFEILGEANGVTVIDDYAHNPTKIRAALAAARERFPGKRIWAIWQPHTYSRTLTLMDDFLRAFGDANQVAITEVYAAREKAADFDNFSAAALASQMNQPQAVFTNTLAETTAHLLNRLQPGDVVVVLSAGDANQVGKQVLSSLKERVA